MNKRLKLLNLIKTVVISGSAFVTIPVVTTSCNKNKKTINTINVVDGFVLNNKVANLHVGDTIELSISKIKPINAASKPVIWDSSNPTIATVDSNGLVIAAAIGNATITATIDNASATCEISVGEYPSMSLHNCLMVIANEESTFSLIENDVEYDSSYNPNFEYSIDGKNWKTNTNSISIKSNETLYLKGNNPDGWSKSMNKYSTFNFTGNVSISGRLMSLIDSGTKSINAIPCDYCFYNLFKGSIGISSVSLIGDFLPDTTPSCYCYYGMFENCTSLTNAPELPATTLQTACYAYMFKDCTSLKISPELPATELAEYCYIGMFQGCTSLIDTPTLQAETLKTACYAYMFKDCTLLKKAPNLSAENLANECYKYMFEGCTSLIKASYLPAKKLTDSCYKGMFEGCTLLSNAPVLPAETLGKYCYSEMFKDCKSLLEAPRLPATTLKYGCYTYMFSGCTSLCSVRIDYVEAYDTSYFLNWVFNIYDFGVFYYNGESTPQDFGFGDYWEKNKDKIITKIELEETNLEFNINSSDWIIEPLKIRIYYDDDYDYVDDINKMMYSSIICDNERYNWIVKESVFFNENKLIIVPKEFIARGEWKNVKFQITFQLEYSESIFTTSCNVSLNINM